MEKRDGIVISARWAVLSAASRPCLPSPGPPPHSKRRPMDLRVQKGTVMHCPHKRQWLTLHIKGWRATHTHAFSSPTLQQLLGTRRDRGSRWVDLVHIRPRAGPEQALICRGATESGPLQAQVCFHIQLQYTGTLNQSQSVPASPMHSQFTTVSQACD